MNLEIGDWVDIGYRPAKVLCVSSDGYVNVSEVYEEISIGCLKPIPITSEILEKNGFEFIEEDDDTLFYTCNISKHRCTANLCKNSPMNLIVSDGMININIYVSYVHELQHALRLCNIDKDIEL